MAATQTGYAEETAGSILTKNVLTASPNQELKHIFQAITDESWDDIQYAYVVNDAHKLVGTVDLAKFSKTDASYSLQDLMAPPTVTISPHADQEKVVLVAVKNDMAAVPVVDKTGVFLGAVPAKKIIGVMHQEHLEDALLTSGIRGRGSHILKLATARYEVVIGSRAPWLIFGAAIGLGLGFISSLFERTLAENVAIAYFVPVVAYIADSVGTQSEAITVRALATLKINIFRYMVRELFVGLALGALLGGLGVIGASLISKSPEIGAVVGLSLFTASATAAIMASLIPIIFKKLGKDPALGSGPFATALQDVISVLVYFAFAVALL